MQIDTEKLNEMVTEKVSNELFNMYHDGWKQTIVSRIERQIDAIIEETAHKTIKDTVERITTDAFHTTYQPIDPFGRACGTPTSIAETLEKATRDYWSMKVDRNGNPTNDTYGQKSTRAEHFIAKAMGENIDKTLDQAVIVELAAKVKDAIRSNLRDAIDQKLAAVFNVRTHVDREEGRSK